jgi:hypothetical protein
MPVGSDAFKITGRLAQGERSPAILARMKK